MPDKPSESKKVIREANVTETSAKKSDHKQSSDKLISDRKYSFGFAPLLLSALIIALLAGIIGYGASQNKNDRLHDKMMDGYGSRGDFDSYRTRAGGLYDMNKKLHGLSGEVESVSDAEISIKPLQGGITTFKIDSNTKVYNGTQEKSVKDLKSGDNVTIQPDQTDPTLAYKVLIN